MDEVLEFDAGGAGGPAVSGAEEEYHRRSVAQPLDFGVIDSEPDRIYTGPDFVGSGYPASARCLRALNGPSAAVPAIAVPGTRQHRRNV